MTTTGIYACVERQATRDLEQHVAAACRHQGRGAGRASIQDDVTTGLEHDGPVAGGAQVFAGVGCRCACRCVCCNPLNRHAQAVDGHAVGFGDEEATAVGLGRQTRDRGFDVVGARANARACLQDQVRGADVHRVGIAAHVDDRTVCSGDQGDMAGACVDDGQGDAVVDCVCCVGVARLQADVAIVARRAGRCTHQDVVTGQQVYGLVCTAGGDVGVLDDVTTGIQADVAAAAEHACAQRDVARCIASLQQQVVCCTDCATRFGRDRARCGLQHQMACRVQIALRCVGGCGQRGAVQTDLIDVDGVERADGDGVGFGQEQATGAGASHVGCQTIDADLQVVCVRARALSVCHARGDDAQFVGYDVQGRACVGDAFCAQAHVTSTGCLDSAQRHGAVGHHTDVGVGRAEHCVGIHGDCRAHASGPHINRASDGAEITCCRIGLRTTGDC